MFHKKLFWILLALCLVFGAALSLAQDCDCPPDASDITIYYDPNMLTIYAPPGRTALHGINFSTTIENQAAHFFLEDYPTFRALNLDNLEGPYCLYLQVAGSVVSPPMACTALPPDQQVIQNVTPGQSFWHDDDTDQMRSMTLRHYGDPLETCTSASPTCTITIPPYAEPVFTEPCTNPVLCELFLDREQLQFGAQFAYSGGDGVFSDSLTPDCARSGDNGLLLDFDMSQGGFGGWGVDLAPGREFDASQYDLLTFWIKTDALADFEIGIKDKEGHEPRTTLRNAAVLQSDMWTIAQVSLDYFANQGLNLSRVENISFGFNAAHGAGRVCVDNISFARAVQTIASSEPVNARSGPCISCDVVAQFTTPQTLYTVAEGVRGTTVNNNDDWILAMYDDQYMYIHSSVVEFPEQVPLDVTPTVTDAPTSVVLVIANFDDGARINNLGFEMGAFEYDPDNTGNRASERYENGQAHIDFSFDPGGFGGFWLQLGGTNAIGYDRLTFDITATAAFPIKVELKRAENGVVGATDINVTTTIQPVTIPLANFDLSSLTDLSELVFVLEQARAGNSGTVTIDNIVLR